MEITTGGDWLLLSRPSASGDAKRLAQLLGAATELPGQFNGMQLCEADFVAYKPFHNQLRKPGFASFMALLTRQDMSRLIKQHQ